MAMCSSRRNRLEEGAGSQLEGRYLHRRQGQAGPDSACPPTVHPARYSTCTKMARGLGVRMSKHGGVWVPHPSPDSPGTAGRPDLQQHEARLPLYTSPSLKLPAEKHSGTGQQGLGLIAP